MVGKQVVCIEKNPEGCPLEVRIVREDWRGTGAPPVLSVIVPSRDGHGGGLIDKLREALKGQTFKNLEFILVIGDKRQGRAINSGVKCARGEYVMTMDDDTVLLFPCTISRVIDTFINDPGIGMAGVSCIVPKDSSEFQQQACRQIPRRYFPIKKATCDSDMVQHPLLAMPKRVFLEIGGEDEELVRGLDPLLRYKTRKAGYRVVIVGGAAIAHMLPPSFPKVLAQYARNGRGSAFAKKYYPGKIYESASGYEGDNFTAVRPFWFRVSRKVFNIFLSVVKCEFIRVGAELAYTFGYVQEYLFGSEKPE